MNSYKFSSSTFIVFFFVDVVLLTKYRQFIKFLYGLSINDRACFHAVICGAGMNSSLFIGLIEKVVNKGFKVVAIIDPDKKWVGKRINDLKIYHPDDLEKLISQQHIKRVFFASDEVEQNLSVIREKCSGRDVSFSFLNPSSLIRSTEILN